MPADWVLQHRQFNRERKEREKSEKKIERHGVFRWIANNGTQPYHGGYVVRTGKVQNGKTEYAFPYNQHPDGPPIREYKIESAAQKHADKLNGY